MTSTPSNPLTNNNTAKYKIYISYFVIFLFSFYLTLFNLDRINYWHDEAVTSFYGKNLLNTGTLTGFDGRHALGGENMRALNEELIHVEPPMMSVVTAIGMGIFGEDLFGARFLHALLGFLGVVFIFLYLRLFLRRQTFLLLITVTFIAFSVDLLMYFRQVRYYGEIFFFMALLVYTYEMFYRTKKWKYFIILVLAGCGGLLSQYPMGAANVLAVGAWHLIYRLKSTSIKEYIMYLCGGLFIAVVGLLYLYSIGVLSADLDFSKFSAVEQPGDPENVIYKQVARLLYYAAFLFEINWISWLILLFYLLYLLLQKINIKAEVPSLIKEAIVVKGDENPYSANVHKIFVMGILLLITNSICSVQDLHYVRQLIDSRYYFTVIPFLMIINAAFINYLWLKKKAVAVMIYVIMLSSNLLSYPFTAPNQFTEQSTLGFILVKYVYGLHTEYETFFDVIVKFLAKDAKQDDIVFIPFPKDREVLITLVGDKYYICCNVSNLEDEHAKNLREMHNLPDYMFYNPNQADYLIFTHQAFLPQNQEALMQVFDVVFTSGVVAYKHSHRPDLNIHDWQPQRTTVPQIIIFKKKEELRNSQ